MGLPGGSVVKTAASVGDMGSIPGLGKSPGEGLATIPLFFLGKSHRQRSLVDYSP